ncbi:MAG TPA: AI-2E family transporter [Labilithrix sp.]|jgi:predicted PurR-regulated permease PerM
MTTGIDTPSLTPPSPSPSQRRALGILALAALAVLVWLSLPLASGIFLGAILAFSLLGTYEWLAVRLKSPGLAAVVLSVGSGLLLVGAITVLLYFVVDRGITAANDLALGLGPDGPLRKSLERLQDAARTSPIGPIDVVGRVRELAGAAASKLTVVAAAAAGVAFDALLLLFFSIMTSFFVLRHWTTLAARAERILPFHPLHTRATLVEFREVGRQVFLGTLLTGIAQGVLAGIGYAIVGLPEPALLGALTAIASLIPAIGTLLIWVPAGAVLVFSGHPVSGVFVFLWGALVVGVLLDYFVRPRLLGRNRHVPKLFMFISIFGGVAVFGLLGLVLGPVIASVSVAILRVYNRQFDPGA